MMDALVLKILLFILLILLSAFFSSSETAFFSLNRRDIENRKKDESAPALRVLRLLAFPRRLLITIVTGNTFVNISLGVLSASIAHDAAQAFNLSELAVLFIEVIAVTFTVLIFGEILPKVLAIRKPESYSLSISRIISLVSVLLRPLTEIFYHITELSARFLMIEKEQLFSSEEDFYTLVELGEQEGAIRKKEKDMIKSLVRFSDTAVREVMIPRPDMTAIDVNISREGLLTFIRTHKYSRYPAFDSDMDTIVGFIFEKDILRYMDSDEDHFPDIHSLIRPVLYVPENKSINLVLKEFQQKKTKIAIAVDEYGGTSGLITLEDVLEEILGEIQDEKDQEGPPVSWMSSTELVADASMNIDDFGEMISLAFPEERNYDTLGGFFMETLGQIPKRHDSCSYSGFSFTVESMMKRRIKKLRIKKLS